MISVHGHRQVPWGSALSDSLLRGLPWHNQQLGQRFADVLSHRLCNSTVQACSSKLNKFAAFAASLGAAVVPASVELIYEYLAHLSLEGAVHPKHFAQYLAVINSMHRDLGLPTPWMDTGLCQAFQHSAQKLVTEAASVRPVRQPLLASQVLQFVRLGVLSLDVAVVRAAAAVLVAFLTFVRGASIMQLAVGDVVLLDQGGEVRVWDEKTRKGSGVARSVPVEWGLCPAAGRLVQRWVLLREHAWSRSQGGGLCQGFFQLPGEPFPLREGVLCSCVQQCVYAAGLPAEVAVGLQGHSCRSGGLSALHALGGSVLQAAARGGWAQLSTVFQHYLYLDVVPSVEAFQLLGFLLPPAVRHAACVHYGLQL